MARAVDRHIRFRLGLALLAVGLAVSGCESGLPRSGEGAGLAAGPRAQVVERDVAAPGVFEQEEPGLWDGRPSLGGVWVAHPEATDPERVVIRNVETGASVTGALFRRERDNPGPRFQISSEAANALGILPGRPTPVRVTALRLERVEAAPTAAPVAEAPGEETAAEAPAPAAAAQQPQAGGLRRFFQRYRAPVEPEPAPEAEPATRGAVSGGALAR